MGALIRIDNLLLYKRLIPVAKPGSLQEVGPHTARLGRRSSIFSSNRSLLFPRTLRGAQGPVTPVETYRSGTSFFPTMKKLSPGTQYLNQPFEGKWIYTTRRAEIYEDKQTDTQTSRKTGRQTDR